MIFTMVLAYTKVMVTSIMGELLAFLNTAVVQIQLKNIYNFNSIPLEFVLFTELYHKITLFLLYGFEKPKYIKYIS